MRQHGASGAADRLAAARSLGLKFVGRSNPRRRAATGSRRQTRGSRRTATGDRQGCCCRKTKGRRRRAPCPADTSGGTSDCPAVADFPSTAGDPIANRCRFPQGVGRRAGDRLAEARLAARGRWPGKRSCVGEPGLVVRHDRPSRGASHRPTDRGQRTHGRDGAGGIRDREGRAAAPRNIPTPQPLRKPRPIPPRTWIPKQRSR